MQSKPYGESQSGSDLNTLTLQRFWLEGEIVRGGRPSQPEGRVPVAPRRATTSTQDSRISLLLSYF